MTETEKYYEDILQEMKAWDNYSPSQKDKENKAWDDYREFLSQITSWKVVY